MTAERLQPVPQEQVSESNVLDLLARQELLKTPEAIELEVGAKLLFIGAWAVGKSIESAMDYSEERKAA